MGAPKLFAAAAGISLAARGACAALCVELQNGDWGCADDVTATFPRAQWSKRRIIINVAEALDAIVTFNFERGIALIDIEQPSGVRIAAPAARTRSNK